MSRASRREKCGAGKHSVVFQPRARRSRRARNPPSHGRKVRSHAGERRACRTAAQLPGGAHGDELAVGDCRERNARRARGTTTGGDGSVSGRAVEVPEQCSSLEVGRSARDRAWLAGGGGHGGTGRRATESCRMAPGGRAIEYDRLRSADLPWARARGRRTASRRATAFRVGAAVSRDAPAGDDSARRSARENREAR